MGIPQENEGGFLIAKILLIFRYFYSIFMVNNQLLLTVCNMQDKDLNRNYYFSSIGIHILRFSNKAIADNINSVVTISNTTILKLIANYPKT